MTIKKPRLINTELGKEKLCNKCDEYFPLSKEFFFCNGKTKQGIQKFTSACRDCYTKNYRPHRLVKGEYVGKGAAK